MTSPSNSAVQNLLPVQAYFNLDGSFSTFIGQGTPFYATANPVQSGLTITNSTINSSVIGGSVPAAGTFTSFATTTGTISTNASSATDIVNLLTLQSYAAGISWKNPVTAATLTNITLSGTQTVDGVALVTGNTVLVKNQTNNTQNGIYQVNAGAWTYATGSTTWAQYVSAVVFVEYGTQGGSAWYCTALPGGILGTTAMTWSNFTVSSTYSAGTGLTLAAGVFSITNTGVAANTYGSATASPVFAVNAQGQITSVTNTTITPALGSITGFGTGVATFLATPTSANLAAAVSDETGTGALVFATSPTFVTPALGTPVSGVVTNLTGTASININGSVGSTTPNTGAFTVLSTSSTTNTTPTLSFNASNSSFAMGATISSSYLQSMLQNKSGTAGASTNYVLSNDLGTDSTYYGEFGMNSSVFSASTPGDFFSINNGIYFSGHDGDVTVGSGNGFKTYFAWGATAGSAHVINSTGALGFSTNLGTTPATSGTTGFGTAGQVLSSNGSGSAPTWVNPSALTTAAGGSNTQIQYNSSGALAGSANMTFNGTTLTLANDASISGLTVGKGAGSFNTNAILGYQAFQANSSGQYSIAIGYQSLYNNTTGNNIGIGFQPLFANTTGADNVAIGFYGLKANTTGNYNTAIGDYALQSNTTGGSNTALGSQALYSNTTASNNTAVGYQAGYSQATNTGTTAIGYKALLSTTGAYCTAVGHQAGYTNTSGAITAFGVNSLYSNTTGVYNVAVGGLDSANNGTLSANTTGSNNTGIGAGALGANTTASNNTAVGYQAGYSNTTGDNNTSVGFQAAYTNTTGSITAIGFKSGQLNATGTGLTFVGYQAGNKNTGNDNTALGHNCLYYTTSGASNTAIGRDALFSNTTASNNTAVGYQAGYANTTGTGNTFVGQYAGGNKTTGSYCVYIGQNTAGSSATIDSEVVIGQGGTGKGAGTFFAASASAGVYNSGNSAVWQTTSDQRIKKNIVDNNIGLDVISQIQVKNFEYRLPEEVTELPSHSTVEKAGIQLGVIAQELKTVLPECVTEQSTGVLSVNTGDLTWYLINAVKEQQAMIETLTTRLNALEGK